MATKVKLGTDAQWGVKENGLLGFNDENGVFKAIELASSRASSGTYVAQSGLIADAEVGVPRIDWTNGVGELLLEPQSTNLVTTSNSGFVGSDATITYNTATSPDGSVNAQEVEATGTNAFARTSNITLSATHTFSVFLKYVDKQWVQLANSGSANDYVNVDIQNGVFGDSGSSVTNEKIISLGNGWYRVSADFASTGSRTLRVYMVSGSSSSYATGSASVGESFLSFGWQVEELSYPTSYIRTEGSAVTRIADAVTGNSSLGQVINSSEGVLYAEMSALANDGTQNLLGLNGGSISNSILFGFSSSNGIRFYGAESGTGTGFDLTTAATITSNLKVALRWSLNDVKFYINGTQVGTDTTFATSSSLNELSFDNGSGASHFYGRVRELKVYDTALTDAELTTLTTL